MKIEVFKNLIKEAVRDVLREELGSVIGKKQPTEFLKQVQDVKTITPENNKFTPVHKDPFTQMFEMTKASMTKEDFKNLGGGVVDGGRMQESVQKQTPVQEFSGLESSFLKNAGAIYKASIEKDKQRHL